MVKEIWNRSTFGEVKATLWCHHLYSQWPMCRFRATP